MSVVFWLAISLVAYVYFGYPALLVVLSGLRRPVPGRQADITPAVSLIIAAYNESAVIEEKMRNSLSLDYPQELLEIAVSVDGATDGTGDKVKRFLQHGVKLFNYEHRRGKSDAVNETVPQTGGEIIVFSDANAMYADDAIKKIVRNFAEPEVGCVCGEVTFINTADSAVSSGEGLYWRYESMIKRKEMDLGSTLMGAGTIYAIRRELFQPVEPWLADDFVTPLRIASRGYRVVYEPEARAYEKTSITTRDEFNRKARIIAQDSRAYFKLKGMLSPFRPRLAWQLFSHKFLRWLVPVFLLAALLASLFLAITGSLFYTVLLALQGLFYLMAAAGLIFQVSGSKVKIFYVPFYFCMVNSAALLGLGKLVFGRKLATWSPASTTR
jgi:cellulose synthase/poly-beta-1,6-N-acetylglucosamine synthase-like glycosyltransferase